MVPLTVVVSVRRLESVQSVVTAEPTAHRSGIEKDSCLVEQRGSSMVPLTVVVSVESAQSVVTAEPTAHRSGIEKDSC